MALARWIAHAAHAGPHATLVVTILFCALAFGAVQAAWTDPAYNPHAISHLPTKTELSLRGEVAAEPDIHGGLRYLLIDVSAASLDGGQTWQQSSGHAEVSVSGPDDWFALAYGDTLTVKGELIQDSRATHPTLAFYRDRHDSSSSASGA